MPRRALLSWCALLGVAALTTAAAVVDVEHLDVRITPGAQLDLQVAGSAEAGWTPVEADWVQGDPDAYRIDLGDLADLGPGGEVHVRVAARHGVDDLPATVRLVVSDPDDEQGLTDPATGTRTELFDQLRITVAEGDVLLIDVPPGADEAALSHAWTQVWQPGEVRLLDVTIAVPVDLRDDWQGARTDVLLTFLSESA
jgi:hypothetical protein